MKRAIFIRTYDKDLPWLDTLMQSIELFVPTEIALCIVAPASIIPDVCAILRKRILKRRPMGVKPSAYEGRASGYLTQQMDKLEADIYCHPSTNEIMLVDSDCVFTAQLHEEDWSKDGKIVVLKTPYATLGRTVPWRAPTEKFLQRDVSYEYMRRIPCVYHRVSFRMLRHFCLEVHKMPIADYIAKQEAFSEFNAMGAFLELSGSPGYRFIDTENETWEPLPIVQFWSWGGFTPEIRKQMIDCRIDPPQ